MVSLFKVKTKNISCQCSLAVEHPLSKREVVGSNPAIGYVFYVKLGEGIKVIINESALCILEEEGSA